MVDELKILNFSYFYEFALQNKVFSLFKFIEINRWAIGNILSTDVVDNSVDNVSDFAMHYCFLTEISVLPKK